jgi:lipoyl(octanoyl) transferase
MSSTADAPVSSSVLGPGSASGSGGPDGDPRVDRLAAQVIDLGLREYAEVWDIQKQMVTARQQDAIPDTLILVEHPHVITLGRGTEQTDLLSVAGIPTFAIERGGGVTYHGPGQLVGYPVIRLREHERDLHRYLRNLEETLLRVVADFGIPGIRNPGWTGVWTAPGAAISPEGSAVEGSVAEGSAADERHPEAERPSRKLASIGVAVKRWVTLHGFALNVSTDLARFRAINPCGLEAGVMGSLASVLGREVAMAEVKARVRHHFGEVFGRAWS